MRTDNVAEMAETHLDAHYFKVHSSICTELLKLVHRISRVFPKIEKARPRCSSGIQALCLLQLANEEAKLLLQYCSESSKLYLAMTSDKVVSRCDQLRNLLEHNLGQIQSMVSVTLAAEIGKLRNDLRGAMFILDPSDKQAGKIMRDFLKESASASHSGESSAIKALRAATSKLHITSSKALVIEKRSITVLLDKVGDSNPTKGRILKYLLYQLRKYGNFIMEEQTENACAPHHEESSDAQMEAFDGAVPPQEFKCPISFRATYAAVVIASGHTNEASERCNSNKHIEKTDLDLLSCLAQLQWESQCKAVEDITNRLNFKDQIFHTMPSANCFEQLIRFLREAHDQHDLKARRAGSQLLLEFVSRSRSGIPYLHEDAFSLLASLLDSDLTQEALAILDILSGHQDCRSNIAESDALSFILENFDSTLRDFQEPAIKVVCNLSSDKDICSQVVSLDCIPKLVPFLVDTVLTRYCIVILRNVCDTKNGRAGIVETEGCIGSIAELLDIGNQEDQVHSISILLSLCSQCEQYCQLVMDEGVIPALVNISITGNENGKAYAQELLLLLRDINRENSY